MEELAEPCEVELFRFGSGVKIEFTRAGRESFDDAQEARAGHAAGVTQAKDSIGSADAARGKGARGAETQRAEDERDGCAVAGFADEAHRCKVVLDRLTEREAEDGGMEVEMRVAVEIAGREAKFGEALELRGDLAGERRAGARVERVTQPGARGRADEAAARVGERGCFGGTTVAESEVQADAEQGISLRDAHSFVGARLVDHETGLREQAGLVMAFDGFVDGVAAAEVVASEDQLFQLTRRVGSLSARMTMCPFLRALRKA